MQKNLPEEVTEVDWIREMSMPVASPTGSASGSPNSINTYVSVAKAESQLEGHRLCCELEKDGLRQIYFPKTIRMNN